MHRLIVSFSFSSIPFVWGMFASHVVYPQSEAYLSSRDSASFYFERKDFFIAKSFLKLCIQTDDFKRTDFYYLASCYSKLIILDSAAFYFNIALSLGLKSNSIEKIDMDENIDELIKSKKWNSLKKRFIENSTAQPILNEALKLSLAERVKLDQKYRSIPNHGLSSWEAQDSLDKSNQVWLDSVIARHGWPTRSLVGDEGSINAWLIVQHADNNLTFQKRCLAILQKLIKTNDVPLANFAYLQDRVLVNECKPQMYGTQYSLIYDQYGDVRSIEFKPISDSKLVDKRRKYMNMVSLEEYRLEVLTSLKRKK